MLDDKDCRGKRGKLQNYFFRCMSDDKCLLKCLLTSLYTEGSVCVGGEVNALTPFFTERLIYMPTCLLFSFV